MSLDGATLIVMSNHQVRALGDKSAGWSVRSVFLLNVRCTGMTDGCPFTEHTVILPQLSTVEPANLFFMPHIVKLIINM